MRSVRSSSLSPPASTPVPGPGPCAAPRSEMGVGQPGQTHRAGLGAELAQQLATEQGLAGADSPVTLMNPPLGKRPVEHLHGLLVGAGRNRNRCSGSGRRGLPQSEVAQIHAPSRPESRARSRRQPRISDMAPPPSGRADWQQPGSAATWEKECSTGASSRISPWGIPFVEQLGGALQLFLPGVFFHHGGLEQDHQLHLAVALPAVGEGLADPGMSPSRGHLADDLLPVGLHQTTDDDDVPIVGLHHGIGLADGALGQRQHQGSAVPTLMVLLCSSVSMTEGWICSNTLPCSSIWGVTSRAIPRRRGSAPRSG